MLPCCTHCQLNPGAALRQLYHFFPDPRLPDKCLKIKLQKYFNLLWQHVGCRRRTLGNTQAGQPDPRHRPQVARSASSLLPIPVITTKKMMMMMLLMVMLRQHSSTWTKLCFCLLWLFSYFICGPRRQKTQGPSARCKSMSSWTSPCQFA